MGARSSQRFRVRVHTITDYTVQANVVNADELKGDLLVVHKEGGIDVLVETISGMLVDEEHSIIGSHGLEVELAIVSSEGG